MNTKDRKNDGNKMEEKSFADFQTELERKFEEMFGSFDLNEETQVNDNEELL